MARILKLAPGGKGFDISGEPKNSQESLPGRASAGRCALESAVKGADDRHDRGRLEYVLAHVRPTTNPGGQGFCIGK